jgi:4-amino-4-deoxy-L-arabinose transferase-like glycosyltransferase
LTIEIKHGGRAGPSGHGNFFFLFLTCVLLLGLYLRLFMVSATEIETPFRADARQYTAYAYNLRLHGIYSKDFESLKDANHQPEPDAFRSPGYPIFLYPFTATRQLDRFAITVFYLQAILSTATIAVVYCIGRRAIGPVGASAAAALTAISPHLINLNVYLLTETLFTFFLTGGIAFLVSSIKSNRAGLWLLSGLTLGFAALIKPTLQYYVLFLIVFILIHSGFQRRIRTSLLVGIPFSILFSLWLLRNLATLGYLSDPTLTINTLHHGMYPQFMYDGLPHTFGYPYRFDPEGKAIAGSMQNVITAIGNRFCDQPLKYLGWYLSKPFYFFGWEMIQGRGTFIYPVLSSPYQASPMFGFIDGFMRWVHPFMVGSSILGAILVWLPKHRLAIDREHFLPARLLSLTYAYFILVHIAGAPFPRYSIPIRPMTYLLAMIPVCLTIAVIEKKRSATPEKGQP